MNPAPDGCSSLEIVRYHLDRPTTWVFHPPCIILSGWCADDTLTPPDAIRVKIGEHFYPGVTKLPRPDVAAHGVGPINCGFEIRAPVRKGDATLAIDAQWKSTWRHLDTRNFVTRGRWLPAWLRWNNAEEMLAFQLPAHATHCPRALRRESFPRSSAKTRVKLTVVTPSFNQAPYLSQTIQSVLASPQTQYVVQDGGSTDGSVKIIRAYADRLYAWESIADGGQAQAILRGFAKTRGRDEDVMAWINSDDFYLPGALDYVTDYFTRNPHVDVLYGHRVLVDAESQEIGRWFLPRHDPHVLKLNDFIPQETLFWRRRAWNRCGGLDPSFRFAMDWDLLLRFQSTGATIVRLPYFLACFRAHPNQKTAAAMHSVGYREIDFIRERECQRRVTASELLANTRIRGYLRRSSFIQWLWQLGIRAP
jgi:glycosyltransferase involved in cell wall biosynthesis